jgi:hypothetical protein
VRSSCLLSSETRMLTQALLLLFFSASLDVIGMEKFPLQNVLGEELGKGLMAYHEKQGVKVSCRYLPSPFVVLSFRSRS